MADTTDLSNGVVGAPLDGGRKSIALIPDEPLRADLYGWFDFYLGKVDSDAYMFDVKLEGRGDVRVAFEPESSVDEGRDGMKSWQNLNRVLRRYSGYEVKGEMSHVGGVVRLTKRG